MAELDLAGVETETRGSWASVETVAKNWVTDGGAVNPELIGPARDRFKSDEGSAFVDVQWPQPGEGGTPFGTDLPGWYFAADPADGRGDLAGFRHLAVDQGDVFLADFAIFKLERQGGGRGRVFGDKQDSGGIAVETVGKRRSPIFAAPVAEQGVGDGTMALPGGWVNQHAGLFVECDQRLVFIKDFEWQILGEDGSLGLGIERELDELAGFETVAGGHSLTVDAAGSTSRRLPQGEPGKGWQMPKEKLLHRSLRRRGDHKLVGQSLLHATL